MYVSELRLYDFRQFKSVDGKPGLEVRFHPGLNALVGENGSGKTTVVDAMRYVLLTQSGEFVRPTEDDFNVRADGTSARELSFHLWFLSVAGWRYPLAARATAARAAHVCYHFAPEASLLARPFRRSARGRDVGMEIRASGVGSPGGHGRPFPSYGGIG